MGNVSSHGMYVVNENRWHIRFESPFSLQTDRFKENRAIRYRLGCTVQNSQIGIVATTADQFRLRTTSSQRHQVVERMIPIGKFRLSMKPASKETTHILLVIYLAQSDVIFLKKIGKLVGNLAHPKISIFTR